MLVTQVTELSKSRSKVYIDQEFAFVLYKGELRLYGVREQEELSEESYREIMQEVLPKRATLRCMNLLQSRRETRLLWEIGTADTKINWKGKGYLCGHHMKVRVQGSEKGTEIPAGAPVMVVGMEGFKPVVAQV